MIQGPPIQGEAIRDPDPHHDDMAVLPLKRFHLGPPGYSEHL